MPAARCCCCCRFAALVFCLLALATATWGGDADGAPSFRLDFAPFATLEMPSHVIHASNRAAATGGLGSGGGRRRSAAAREEEKRDPCYAVVVKLGECKVAKNDPKYYIYIYIYL